ncbi:MAG TPA: hypothetical protein DDZ80_01190 [Cyanobacteria bacterium UBA8803]|nr:hypothetical protein [Cyanobacteria bacterium UBA9273]HBL57220.1 hypothetical protein [Cyanobacteria bacterium UBA8803]
MNNQHNIEEATEYLNQTLIGYEVIPANFGWHIHKKDAYYGLLQYQSTEGWQGSALNHLPSEVKDQLKTFERSVPSLLQVAA